MDTGIICLLMCAHIHVFTGNCGIESCWHLCVPHFCVEFLNKAHNRCHVHSEDTGRSLAVGVRQPELASESET